MMNKLRISKTVRIFIFGGLWTIFSGLFGAEARPLRIGVVLDGPWLGNDLTIDLFHKEISELLRGEIEARFPDDKTLTADWTLIGVNKALTQLLDDPGVDLVIAAGVLASHQACLRQNLQKPVVAPFVIDAGIQGLPHKDGVSGIKNLSYLDIPQTVQRDVKAFYDIYPFKKLAVLLSKPFLEAIPSLQKPIEQTFFEQNLKFEFIRVGTSAEEALRAIPPDVDGVYIGAMIHLAPAEYAHLVQGLIKLRLPSFALLGETDVKQGFMAGILPETYFPQLARRLALNIQRIAGGQDAGTLPTGFAVGQKLTINMATARAIGFYPRWDILTEAELLNHEVEPAGQSISLVEAIKEAMLQNLDITASEQNVIAGAQDVRIARSYLRPNLQVNTLGTQIDRDRAGLYPEREVAAGLKWTQPIFSEPLLANLNIQRQLQQGREADHEAQRQDIGRAAAIAYLNVLQVKTFVHIQRDNLKKTHANLELARVRQAIGAGWPGELHRWEVEIATRRKDVIDADARRQIAEIALSQVLHRQLTEVVATRDIGVGDSLLSMIKSQVVIYMDNPLTFEIAKDFMAQLTLENSPELKQLDTAIAAQQRALQSSQRDIWLPDLALQAEVKQHVYKDGVGAQSYPGAPDDTEWSVGIQASLPLYKGSRDVAEKNKAAAILKQLQAQRRSLVEKLTQNTWMNMHLAGAAHAGIDQTYEAAAAARKNLEIITNNYSTGSLSVVELIDAQNAALVAELAAANSVYDFLIDLVNFQRAVGQVLLLLDPAQQTVFLSRLGAHFKKVGFTPQ